MKKLTPLVLLAITIISCYHHEVTQFDFWPDVQTKFMKEKLNFQSKYRNGGNGIIKQRALNDYREWVKSYIDSINGINDWIGKVTSINANSSFAEFKINAGDNIIFTGVIGVKELMYERLAKVEVDSFVQISGLPLSIQEYAEEVGPPTFNFALGKIKKIHVKE